MPNEDSQYACCTLPNGDEWHLPFRETREHGILIDVAAGLEKSGLFIAPVTERKPVKLTYGGGWSVAPFIFKSIAFPKT